MLLGLQADDYTVRLQVDDEPHQCVINNLTNSHLQCKPDQSVLDLVSSPDHPVDAQVEVRKTTDLIHDE